MYYTIWNILTGLIQTYLYTVQHNVKQPIIIVFAAQNIYPDIPKNWNESLQNQRKMSPIHKFSTGKVSSGMGYMLIFI